MLWPQLNPPQKDPMTLSKLGLYEQPRHLENARSG